MLSFCFTSFHWSDFSVLECNFQWITYGTLGFVWSVIHNIFWCPLLISLNRSDNNYLIIEIFNSFTFLHIVFNVYTPPAVLHARIQSSTIFSTVLLISIRFPMAFLWKLVCLFRVKKFIIFCHFWYCDWNLLKNIKTLIWIDAWWGLEEVGSTNFGL